MSVTKSRPVSGALPFSGKKAKARRLEFMHAENEGRYVKRRYLNARYNLRTPFCPSGRAGVHKDAFFIAYTAEIPTDNMTLTLALLAILISRIFRQHDGDNKNDLLQRTRTH